MNKMMLGEDMQMQTPRLLIIHATQSFSIIVCVQCIAIATATDAAAKMLHANLKYTGPYAIPCRRSAFTLKFITKIGD